MTTRKEALQELLAKVEAGSPDKDDVYAGWPFAMNGEHMHAWGSYNGSLDAAKALHEAVLPGWEWRLRDTGCAWVWRTATDLQGAREADTPARAWLIAIIKTLISAEPS